MAERRRSRTATYSHERRRYDVVPSAHRSYNSKTCSQSNSTRQKMRRCRCAGTPRRETAASWRAFHDMPHTRWGHLPGSSFAVSRTWNHNPDNGIRRLASCFPQVNSVCRPHSTCISHCGQKGFATDGELSHRAPTLPKELTCATRSSREMNGLDPFVVRRSVSGAAEAMILPTCF
jgi:hypothetical protein